SGRRQIGENGMATFASRYVCDDFFFLVAELGRRSTPRGLDIGSPCMTRASKAFRRLASAADTVPRHLGPDSARSLNRRRPRSEARCFSLGESWARKELKLASGVW